MGSYQFENLEGRHAEADLLSERAQLRLAGFPDLLRRHGFPRQGRALEVGCAQGIRTRLMAEKFPEVEVVGIDRSPELLNAARELDQGAANLSYRECDVYDLPFENGSFDFVYARLVFMHLADPVRALRSLKRVLRPGGKILIEDADRDCMFFEPSPPGFKDFWQKVQEGQRRHGGDPNIGRKLASYLKGEYFGNVVIESQPILGDGKEIEFLARTLMPSLNLYLESQDRPGGEAAIAALRNLALDPRATFYHFWFAVAGEKR